MLDNAIFYFRLSSDVKYCAVQSPVLFCIYLDSSKLKEYEYKYYIGNTFPGALRRLCERVRYAVQSQLIKNHVL